MTEFKQRSKPRIVFFGTPEIAAETLDSLLKSKVVEVVAIVTQPDRPARRKQLLTTSPVKGIAHANSIPLLQPEKIKGSEEDFLAALRKFGDFDKGFAKEFDGAVVVAFGQILPQSVLDFFSGRCINIHYSLLPRWRGAAPVQSAILEGDTETGVCLIKMEAGLDSGPIYVSEKTKIFKDDTTGTLMSRLALIGIELINRNIIAIFAGTQSAEAQSNEGITLAAKIKKEAALLNWNHPAEELERKIRAFSPKPGAYTFLHGERFRILASSIINDQLPEAEPGEILSCSNDILLVKTGTSALSVTTLQREGRPTLEISQFLLGFNFKKGDKFLS